MLRPIPDPWPLVVKNGSYSLASRVASKPGPASLIRHSTFFLSTKESIRTRRPSRRNARHGICCVGKQIQDYLLQLHSISPHARRLAGERALHPHLAPTQLCPHQGQGIADDRRKVMQVLAGSFFAQKVRNRRMISPACKADAPIRSKQVNNCRRFSSVRSLKYREQAFA